MQNLLAILTILGKSQSKTENKTESKTLDTILIEIPSSMLEISAQNVPQISDQVLGPRISDLRNLSPDRPNAVPRNVKPSRDSCNFG
jgi:hypothetical protein